MLLNRPHPTRIGSLLLCVRLPGHRFPEVVAEAGVVVAAARVVVAEARVAAEVRAVAAT